MILIFIISNLIILLQNKAFFCVKANFFAYHCTKWNCRPAWILCVWTTPEGEMEIRYIFARFCMTDVFQNLSIEASDASYQVVIDIPQKMIMLSRVEMKAWFNIPYNGGETEIGQVQLREIWVWILQIFVACRWSIHFLTPIELDETIIPNER